MTSARAYLDNQASTAVDPRVSAAMLPYFFDRPGNPHASEHAFGWTANAAVERAVGQLTKAIGADDDEIVFTSGATESNNLAILGLAARAPANRRRILVTAVEHKSVLAASWAAAKRFGCETELLPVDSEGTLQLDALRKRLAEDVLLVSVMGVNNEVGSRQSIDEVAHLCREVGALLHSDCVQALAVGQVDVRQLDVDMLSLSGHKLYGPKGLGILYINRKCHALVEPLVYGGGQQNGLRAGTVPVPLCVGFGEAVALMGGVGAVEERRQLARLRDFLVEELIGIHPGARMVRR